MIPDEAVTAAAKEYCCPNCDCDPSLAYCAITHDRERIARILSAAAPHMQARPTREVVSTSDIFIDYSRVSEPAFSALAELEEFIGDVDGKTVGWPTDQNTFVDEGIVDAADAVRAFNTLAALLALPAPEGWRPIETAPKDGTLLILWVEAIDKEDSCHPTEGAMAWRTIGHNNFDHDERDVWQFAGWCWQHDHWVEGDGIPVLWMPMPERSDAAGAGLRRADPPAILADNHGEKT